MLQDVVEAHAVLCVYVQELGFVSFWENEFGEGEEFVIDETKRTIEDEIASEEGIRNNAAVKEIKQNMTGTNKHR